MIRNEHYQGGRTNNTVSRGNGLQFLYLSLFFVCYIRDNDK